ncbi:MAG: DNA primase [Candidatus Delongbacteria bacterium]|nr:DNA primase [Candidatus Delongbacteria bacterium]MDD4204922.1 DNA primase [Candidatus Delongbacteria bacterium]
MIPKDQIEKLQNSVNIVDVIGERIDIRRAGSNYKARCPFHDEKTPSFMISDSKQIFKCFGCGASGDSIKFVMMYDNLSYPDAIRSLASKYGIEIKEEYDGTVRDRTEDDKKEVLRILNGLACDLFHEHLITEMTKQNSHVKKYVESRKIDNELLTKFRLGYAPDDWHALRNDLRFSQYQDETLVEAGLRKQNEKGNIYDQFRNRLMFPIFDQLGNVLAFSGRTFDDQSQPKYLNSPETVLYRKNQVLYGLYQAMDSIRKKREIILVEGNVDLISMHKFGYTNAAAICGTAFTENHALLVKRNAERVFIMLDGDTAGMKSALRTSEIILETGMVPEIVLLPDGSDPDSFLYAEGKESLDKLLDKPLNIIDLSIAFNGLRTDTANSKITAVRTVAESFKHIKDPLTLDMYTNEASLKLQTDKASFEKEIKRNPKSQDIKHTEIKTISGTYTPRNDDAVEFTLIYLMISDNNALKLILSKLTEKDIHNPEASSLFLKIYELFEEGEPVKLNNILIDFDDKFKDFMISFVLSQETAYSGYDGRSGNGKPEEKIMAACNDSIRIIMLRKLSCSIKGLNEELKYTDDPERQNEILQKVSSLKKEQIELSNNKNGL